MKEPKTTIKRDYPDRPIVGVGAVIIKDGKVLLVKRGQEPGYGTWSIPGGAVHLGEKLSQAIEREVLEETGLVVKVGEMVKIYEPVIRDDTGRIKYHYVLIDFICHPISGEISPASDILDAVLVSKSELEQYDLPLVTLALVQECLNDKPKKKKD